MCGVKRRVNVFFVRVHVFDMAVHFMMVLEGPSTIFDRGGQRDRNSIGDNEDLIRLSTIYTRCLASEKGEPPIFGE